MFSIFDYIKWNGEIGVLAYRHPQKNISKYAKLQVQESQEAVILVNGERSQKFGPGTYDLNSPNVPILREFFGIPYGGENPWQVHAWFVNKLVPLDIEWDTNSFPVYDVNFGASVPVCAQGRYGITVTDAERLILKLCLGYPEDGKHGISVRADDFTEQIYGKLMTSTKSFITKVIRENQIGINDITAHLEDISAVLEPKINTLFEEYGCKLSNFYITSIGLDTSTESGQRVQEAIDNQTTQRISGHTWQQSKMFETANNAISNMQGGGFGGLMGAVMMSNMMGMNMMGGQGGSASMMNPAYNQPTCAPAGQQPAQGQQAQGQPAQPAVRDVYCSNCSKKFPSDMKFCPYCGDPYNPCPRCGTDNPNGAARCVNCGTPLTGEGLPQQCPTCRTMVPPGAAFCPGCGRPMSSEPTCPRCGTPTNGAAFCPGCGMKQQ